jgi:hypothetical protein
MGRNLLPNFRIMGTSYQMLLRLDLLGLRSCPGWVIFHIGVQSRLSTIDVFADVLPKPPRQRWHNASFDEI